MHNIKGNLKEEEAHSGVDMGEMRSDKWEWIHKTNTTPSYHQLIFSHTIMTLCILWHILRGYLFDNMLILLHIFLLHCRGEIIYWKNI